AQPKGHGVQFFHSADPVGKSSSYLCVTSVPPNCRSSHPLLLQSHGWLDGTLEEAFAPENFDLAKKDTWPLVRPREDLRFTSREGLKFLKVGPRRVHMQYMREASTKQPLLSLVFIRWGGEDAVVGVSEESNDGDWGTYGCPASDEYMSAVVKKGLMGHPRLTGKLNPSFKFEAFSLFVKNTPAVEAIEHAAPYLRTLLKGKHTTSFWMLWPVDWIDTRGADYAAYVERQALFRAMRALESAGIRTGFPHPPDQYEMITSKTWMASLSLDPRSRLPAGTMVSKGTILSNPQRAARQALAALEFIREGNNIGEHGPSAVNKAGMKKGVVKLGFSWEARYVMIFNGEEDLAEKLTEIMTNEGSLASSCIVQEWVDFDFEMRLYFLPPDEWLPGQKLEPTRVECNAWSGSMENGSRRNFHKLSKEKVLADYWEGDSAAFKAAKKQAVHNAQFLIAWLRSLDAQLVPMVRLDFMCLRTGPGKVQVVFGEYCEMGACCLGWEDGPPTIWRAALDRALE
ncbi:unnamed protein product, partial [Polarella glacialis]